MKLLDVVYYKLFTRELFSMVAHGAYYIVRGRKRYWNVISVR